MATILNRLATLAGTPVIEGHGDLHVGQVLRADGRFGSPTSTGTRYCDHTSGCCPISAALDVAGMTQSLAHAAIVALKYTPLDAATLAQIDRLVRSAFLGAYTDRLTQLGHADLLDERSAS